MFDVRLIGGGQYQAVETAMDYLSSMDDVAEIEAALKSRLGGEEAGVGDFGFNLPKRVEF